MDKKFIFLLGLLTIFLALSAGIFADDDGNSGNRNSMEQDLIYNKECGSCHLAYPVKYLSRASWIKIMSTLDDHFGDNAEMTDADWKHISGFLKEKGSRHSSWGAEDTETRFTTTREFKGEHHEVPRNAVGPQSKVKSYADCQACHTRANQGSFREREIKIPGFRHWDD